VTGREKSASAEFSFLQHLVLLLDSTFEQLTRNSRAQWVYPGTRMRFSTKWLIFSLGGGILITAVLLVFPSALPDTMPAPLDPIAAMVLWPVAVCEFLVGPGPRVGSPNHHLHEGTPLNMLAAVLGVGLSWMFYSSLVLLVTGARHRSQLSEAAPTPSTK